MLLTQIPRLSAETCAIEHASQTHWGKSI